MPSSAPPPVPRPPQPTDQDHAAKKRRMENGSAEARPQSQGATAAPKLNFSAYKNTSSNKPSMFQLDVAAPFDEADAAEKIIYDPTTIARDVLITAGQHPTEPALNYHLQHLRSLFDVVSASTDLETLRWDMVEAQSRLAPPQPFKPHQPHQPQQQQAPPPLIHRPQPQMQPLNTIKQQPPPPSNWHPQYQPPKPHKPAALPSDQPQPPTRQAQNPPPVAPPTHSPAANPPNNPPPAASPPKQSAAVDLTKQRRAVSPPKRSPGIGLPEQTSAIELPKKRGRPRSFQVEVPAPPKEPSRQASVSKMAGKRRSQRAPAQSKIEARVPYPVFGCKWKNCQAELHNLDVLKQHMLKMHIPHHISCEWAKCPSKEILAAAKLFDHVKAQHIDPIAWKLGDGPSVPATVDSETGASPGPLTRPDASQPGGEDSLIFPASYSSIRAFNRVHKKNTPHEKATEILKAVQRLKERIGLGLDPGGCELATPARNKRVSNDEEVYELVGEG
ncbi:C2H2 finger domain protein [Aspergillus sp. HF37]|nr:C2H2 finger domain protein [Aspergillus sp. HF37]